MFASPPVRFALLLSLLTALAPAAGRALEGPGAYRITAPGGVVRIPFELYRDDIRIVGRINGREARLFIDNGSLWDPLLMFGSPRVDELALERTGEIQVGGAGAGDPVMADVAEGITLSFPGIEFTEQTAIVTGYDPGRPNPWAGVEGQVSATFFGHFVVEFDFDEMILTLIEPDGFAYARGGAELPLKPLADDSWAIPAEVRIENGPARSCDVMLDLGTGDPLWFNIGEPGDFAPPTRTLTASLGHGMQGEIFGRYGRVASITIGGYESRDVLAGFSRRDEGGFTGGNAIIGMGLFKRFNVVFDYRGRRLFVAPNRAFGVPAERDMTGMNLRPEADGLRVTSVSAGTPADEAGLRAGDLVVRIDGRPVGEYERPELRAHLRRRGEKVEVGYLRDGRTRAATLTLRRLI